jgi:hypothetical protein
MRERALLRLAYGTRPRHDLAANLHHTVDLRTRPAPCVFSNDTEA